MCPKDQICVINVQHGDVNVAINKYNAIEKWQVCSGRPDDAVMVTILSHHSIDCRVFRSHFGIAWNHDGTGVTPAWWKKDESSRADTM